MASPLRPKFAIYLCDNTARRVAFYIIVKIRGVVPKELYLNLQGVPAEFENATCRTDLQVVESGLNAKEDVIQIMHETISNNAMGMQSSSVRFFMIHPNGQSYINVLNSAPAIRAALDNIEIIQQPDPDADLLTISNPRQMVGVRFLYTPAVPGGGAKTQSVAELKALCKKEDFAGIPA